MPYIKIEKRKVLLYSQDLYYNFNKIILYLYEEYGIMALPVQNNNGYVFSENNSKDVFDALLTFGGDGTFLRGANIAESLDIPVVGFNHGHLGFLCSFPKEMEREGLDLFATEDLEIHSRSRLLVDRNINESFTAFNDLVIKHGESGRLLDLSIEINTEPVTRFTADGLIVSTPAGSTGYNLGAGGPIITPSSKCFIVTPICPHSLTNRPIIFGENDRLEIVLQNDAEAHFKVDGVKGDMLKQGERIYIGKSSRSSWVVPPHENVFHTLQEKMKWSRL